MYRSGVQFPKKYLEHAVCHFRGRARTPAAPLLNSILWLTAGLGCDGDTVAMTAAAQPSIEDIVLGAVPWIPKVRFYSPACCLMSDN